MVSGLAPRSRPKARDGVADPQQRQRGSAVMAALTMKGGQPWMPVSARISGPMPNPADSAAA